MAFTVEQRNKAFDAAKEKARDLIKQMVPGFMQESALEQLDTHPKEILSLVDAILEAVEG
jgi:hypothetical protein